jgi:hypothetical protein
MSDLRIEAPTDSQLEFVAKLCGERGWSSPLAIHSKQEASEIITGILEGTYQPERYVPSGRRYVPEDLVPDYDPDDVPF